MLRILRKALFNLQQKRIRNNKIDADKRIEILLLNLTDELIAKDLVDKNTSLSSFTLYIYNAKRLYGNDTKEIDYLELSQVGREIISVDLGEDYLQNQKV